MPRDLDSASILLWGHVPVEWSRASSRIWTGFDSDHVGVMFFYGPPSVCRAGLAGRTQVVWADLDSGLETRTTLRINRLNSKLRGTSDGCRSRVACHGVPRRADTALSAVPSHVMVQSHFPGSCRTMSRPRMSHTQQPARCNPKRFEMLLEEAGLAQDRPVRVVDLFVFSDADWSAPQPREESPDTTGR